MKSREILITHLCAEETLGLSDLDKAQILSCYDKLNAEILNRTSATKKDEKEEEQLIDQKLEGYTSIFERCLKFAEVEQLEGNAPLFRPFDMLCKELAAGTAAESISEEIAVSMHDILKIVLHKSIELLKRFAQSRQKDFDAWLYQQGYIALIQEYPVLFEKIYFLYTSAIRHIIEVLQHLHEDSNEIYAKFRIDVTQEIVGLQYGASDRHNEGKTVLIFTFMDGAQLVYKPRQMGADLFWSRILNMANEVVPKCHLKAAHVLDRSGYGYQEYIAYDPEVADLHDYYYQCGCLLALVSLLNGSDFHHENLIISGGGPILVDLETMITPVARQDVSSIKDRRLQDEISDLSVLRSLLLTKWVGKTRDGAVNIGAFTAMKEGQKNYPVDSKGAAVSAEAYNEVLLNGFRDMSEAIIIHKAELEEMASSLADVYFRFVLRDTRVYVGLLHYFFNPVYLKNNLFFEAVTARVYAPFLLSCDEETCSKVWRVAKEEQLALQRLDIPIFYSRGSTKAVYDYSGRVLSEEFFLNSPQETMLKNLDHLTQLGVQRQMSIIQDTLGICAEQRELGYQIQFSYDDIRRTPTKDGSISDSELSVALQHIFNSVQQSMLTNGSYSFLIPQKDHNSGRYELDVMNCSLYSGTLGVVYFMLLYTDYFHIPESKQEVLSQIIAWNEELMERIGYLKMEDISLTQGIAGRLMLLWKSSEVVKDIRILEQALLLIGQIKPDQLCKVKETDYFNGLSGLLYTMCGVLHLSKAEPELLAQYPEEIDCGIALIRSCVKEIMNRRDTETGFWFDSETDIKPLSGLAHGQIGYALALSSALEYVEDKVRKAVLVQIQQIIFYEQEVYNQTVCNSPDYRKFNVQLRDTEKSDSGLRFMHGNCSGIVGIVTAVLAMESYGVLPDGSRNQFMEWAVQYLTNQEMVGNDSLCCGTSAWLNLLVRMKLEPGIEQWSDKRFRFFSAELIKNGAVLAGIRSQPDISLFKGLSGIGYSYLRMLGDYPTIEV